MSAYLDLYARHALSNSPRAALSGLLAGAAVAFPVERCVNLSNALEAPAEGDWGYRIERPHLAAIAEAGFDAVRLPVRFGSRWDGRIEPALLARVDEVIGWAEGEGLTVILDLHHFDALMDSPDLHADRFVAIWTELALHYADRGEDLIFELLNTPEGAMTTARAAALYDRVVPVFHEVDPDRWLVVSGGDWASISGMLALPDYGPRVVDSFHYYAPWEFTHQGAEFLDDPPAPRGWGGPSDRAALAVDFGRLTQVEGPIFLREFGVYAGVDPALRARWIEAMREAAEAAGIPWCHWGFAADFGIYDTAARQWNTDLLTAPMPGRLANSGE